MTSAAVKRSPRIQSLPSSASSKVSIISSIGIQTDAGAVVFRINEGPKERIAKINILGSTIVSEARLKKVIQSRGPMAGIIGYVGNTADLAKIDQVFAKFHAHASSLSQAIS